MVVGMISILMSFAHAQSFRIQDVNAAQYPTMQASFYAADAAQQQILTLTPDDFKVTENGDSCPVISVICPPPQNAQVYSLAISVDVSSSMNWDNNRGASFSPIVCVKATLNRLMTLVPFPDNNCCLQKCDDTPLLLQDWTTDSHLITHQLDVLKMGLANNFLNELLAENGGILNLAKSGVHRRVALMLTDAWYSPMTDAQINACIDSCKKYNISFIAAVYSRREANPDGILSSLTKIARATGGFVINDITTVDAAQNIADVLFHAINNGGLCTIEWMSHPQCTLNRSVEITAKPLSRTELSAYQAPPEGLISSTLSPALIKFKPLKPGWTKDTSFVITAGQVDIHVSNITISNAACVPSPTSFVLKAGQKKTISVHFAPQDSSMFNAELSVVSDGCPLGMTISGGYLGVKSKPTIPLRLIYPNGGEVLVMGEDSALKWSGVSSSEKVSLDYSYDAGSHWNPLSDTGVGLHWNWANIPPPTSDSCLARVRERYGSSSVTESEIEWENSRFGVFLSSDPKDSIYLFARGSYVLVVEAATGRLLKTLPGHVKQPFVSTWCADGSLFATAGSDSLVIVWNSQTLDTVRILRTAGALTSVLSFYSNSLLAAGSEDHEVRVWNVVSGTQITASLALWDPVLALAWQDNKTLFGYSSGSKLAKIDIPSGVELSSAYISSATYSGSASISIKSKLIVAITSDSALSICDLSNGALLHTIDSKPYRFLTCRVAPDGNSFFALRSDSVLRFYDISSGTLLRSLRLGTAELINAQWDDQSSVVVFGDLQSKAVYTIKATIPSVQSVLKGVGAPAVNASWNQQNDAVAYTDSASIVRILDGNTGIEKAQWSFPPQAYPMPPEVQWSPDGSTLSVDGSAALYDVRSASVDSLPKGKTTIIFKTRWNPSGTFVAAYGGYDSVWIYTWPSRTLKGYFTSGNQYLGWLNDSIIICIQAAYVSSKNSWIQSLIRYNINTKLSSIQIVDTNNYTLDNTSLQGHYLVRHRFQQLNVYDILTRKQMTLALSLNSSVYDFVESVSKDGEKIAIVANDSLISIVSLFDGSITQRIRSAYSMPHSVFWNYDGSKLLALSAGDPVSLRCWMFSTPVLQADTSDAVFRIVAPIPHTYDVDFGRVQIGSLRDSVVLKSVSNLGAYPFHVRTATIVGADSAAFSVLSTAAPFVVDSMAGQDIEFEFRPTHSGAHSATVIYALGRDTLRQQLSGMGFTEAMVLGVPVVDFGRVRIGDHRDSLINNALVNSSVPAVIVSSVGNGGPDDAQFSFDPLGLPRYVRGGDSLAVGLHFNPARVGRTNTLINFRVDNINATLSMLVLGEGYQDSSLKQPLIQCTASANSPLMCDSVTVDSVLIANVGLDSLRISTGSIGGADAANFSLIQAIDGLVIAPGVSVYRAVSFHATQARDYSASLTIRSNAAVDSVLDVPLHATRGAADYTASVLVSGPLQLCPGDSCEFEFQIVNRGTMQNSFTLRVDSLSSPLSVTTRVESQQSDSIPIHFLAPATPGAYSCHLDVVDSICGCHVVLVQPFVVAATSMQADNAVIPAVLQQKQSAWVVVHNTSDVALTIDSLPPISPFVFDTLSLPLHIAAHDSLQLRVWYTAQDTVFRQLLCSFSATPCDARCSCTISTQALLPNALLRAGDAAAREGDSVSIPIILEQEWSTAQAGVSGYRASLRFNASLLYPVDGTEVGQMEGQNRVLSFSAGNGTAGDTVAVLHFVALLGNDSTTVLQLENPTVKSGVATLTTKDGLFRLLDLCEQGGTRLLNPSGTTDIVSLAPQPASQTLEVITQSVERTGVSLELFTSDGRLMFRLPLNTSEAGEQHLDIDLSAISSGAYMLVLRTPTICRTRMVVKID